MTNKTTIKIAVSDPTRIKRGHQPHRSGAGIHADRRTNRMRTRANQRRFAIQEQ